MALMGLLVLLPWGITWLRRKGWQGTASRGQVLKLVGAVAVGPQQKVVTIEVTHGDRCQWLVLGVTPHAITRLDAVEAPANTGTPTPVPVESFQAALTAHRASP